MRAQRHYHISLFQEEENERDLVRKIYTGGAVKTAVKPDLTPAYKKIEDNLASQFSTKVKLTHNKKGNGSILFEYYSLEELNGLLEKLNIKVS